MVSDKTLQALGSDDVASQPLGSLHDRSDHAASSPTILPKPPKGDQLKWAAVHSVDHAHFFRTDFHSLIPYLGRSMLRAEARPGACLTRTDDPTDYNNRRRRSGPGAAGGHWLGPPEGSGSVAVSPLQGTQPTQPHRVVARHPHCHAPPESGSLAVGSAPRSPTSSPSSRWRPAVEQEPGGFGPSSHRRGRTGARGPHPKSPMGYGSTSMTRQRG
jgi:hypothetical protein